MGIERSGNLKVSQTHISGYVYACV